MEPLGRVVHLEDLEAGVVWVSAVEESVVGIVAIEVVGLGRVVAVVAHMREAVCLLGCYIAESSFGCVEDADMIDPVMIACKLQEDRS